MSPLLKAVDSSNLPANYRTTLRMIVSFCVNDDGVKLYPSLPTVAKKLGRKRSMVQKHVTWLIRQGVLKPAPGHEQRAGGWIAEKRCGQATEYYLDLVRLMAWTPGTAVLGAETSPAAPPPSTRVLGPPSTPVLGPPSTPVPPSSYLSFDLQRDNAETPSAADQHPVHAVENQAAASENLSADEPRPEMLDVAALMQTARSVMLLQNEKGLDTLDETGLRVAMKLHVRANLGLMVDADNEVLVRAVCNQVYRESRSWSRLGGEKPTKTSAPHNTRGVDLLGAS